MFHNVTQIMSNMSTPSRTPHRLYIPTIDTTASKHRSEDLHSYSGWDTPPSVQDRRRPSLSFSALSEPSPTSLPTTPGYGSNNPTTEPFPSYQFEDGNNVARMVNPIKGPALVAPPSHHLDYTHFNPTIAAYPAKHHGCMSMPPDNDSFNMSFSSTTSTEAWEQLPNHNIQHFAPQSIIFRPGQVGSAEAFPEHGDLSRAIYLDGSTPTLGNAVQSCQHGASFDSMTTDFLSPHQLVIPSENQEQGVYPYTQHTDSGISSPMEQQGMGPGQFDSFSSFSSWSQPGSSSPIDEYSLYEEPGSAVMMKDESPLPPSGQEHRQSLMHTPSVCSRRTRHRGKSAIAKRCRAVTHQLVKNFADVDVAIDPKTMEMDVKTGIISKKKVSVETKRWKCSAPGCQSRSARKEHLRRHELSHLPDKQFHCNLPKCGRAITRSDNLIQHLMTHARPPKPGKRNNHHSRERIEQMVLETMTDKKLAERTITNLGKAIEREQEKWPAFETDAEWNNDPDEDTADCVRYDS